MPEPVQKLLDQLGALWGGLSLTQRLLMVALVGGGAAALLLVTVWGYRPDYATLYANLPPADAGQIVEQLKTAHVAYQVEDGGTRILVPAGVVHETRIKLATLGLPQGGGVGYELFDRANFGATDFVQKLNYQRALQGELARTIGQIREVQQARVHIVMPQPSVFTDHERPTTASVVLNLRTGGRLGAEQVRAIVHLVSGAVEGLQADQVTVIDSAGRVLSQRADTAAGPGTSSQLDYQHGIEGDLTRRVQSMLDEVLGAGKTSVRVSAQVEFSHGERTEERVDPNGVVKSEQRTTETTKGTSSRPSGMVGSAANTAATPAGSSAGTSSSNETVKEQESVQYEVGRIVERRTLAAGEIKRLSVAVLVDPPYKVTPGPNGTERKTPLPRDKAELDKLRASVMRAIGFNAARGDEVEVAELAFDTSAVERERVAAEQAEKRYFWVSSAKQAGLGVVALLALLFIGKPILAFLKKRPVGGRLDISDAAFTEALGRIGGTAAAALSPADVAQGQKKEELQGRIANLARSNPEQVAQLIRTWMATKQA
jgi:flagellar M-ring protein FliF